MAKKKKVKKIQDELLMIRLPERAKRRFKAACKKQGQSMSDLLRGWIMDWIS